MELTDIVAIHTLELDKLPAATDGMQLYDWASFVAASSEEELAVIEENNPQARESVVKIRVLSEEERIRDMCERREKSRRDEESNLRWAREEGRKEGRKEWLLDVAKNLLRFGVAVDIIVESTGLTSEDVESLRQ